jgi:hypothetical protein
MRAKHDLKTGDIFDRLTVIRQVPRKAGEAPKYVCSCSCGGEKTVSAYALVDGNTTSCGCKKREETVARNKANRKTPQVQVGDVFERLTTIEKTHEAGINSKWRCVCVCGNEKVTLEGSLLRGETRSCGCLQKERTSAARLTHGLSMDKEYRSIKNKEYRELHKVRLYALRDKRRHEDPVSTCLYSANRRARKLQAAPAWAKARTNATLKQLYAEGHAKLESEGLHYHVDHIVPLTGKRDGEQVVCGLHVWYNLQLIPGADNCSKSCYEWPDM